MNTEKLLAVANKVSEELVNSEIISLLAKSSKNIQAQMNAPSETTSTETSSSIEQLIEVVHNGGFFEYPETWNSIIEQIGLKPIIGESLSRRIQSISINGDLTLASAKQEIDQIQTELRNMESGLSQTISGLESLGITPSKLEGEFAELAVLMPRLTFENEVGQFGKDIAELDKQLLLFSEIYTGEREPAKLREVSTTDPVIFAAVSIPATLGIIQVIRGIVGIMTDTYTMREARANAIVAEFSADAIKVMETEIDKKIETGIEELAAKVADEAIKADKARKNELRVEAKKVLTKIADNMDNGYRFSASASYEDDLEQTDDGEAGPSATAIAASEIRRLSDEIERTTLPDKPVLVISNETPDAVD